MELLRTSSFRRDLQAILEYFDDIHAEDVALRFLDALDEPIDQVGLPGSRQSLGINQAKASRFAISARQGL